MTCKHILELIDALPFAESSQLTTIERHARDCARCQSALEVANALESELNLLPAPEPPTELAAAIISRIEHHNEKHVVSSREAARVTSTRTRSDQRAWTALLTGAMISLSAQMYRLLAGESTLHLVSSFLRGGTEGLIEMPEASPAVLFLATGLLLFVVGLFASHRDTDTSPA